MAVASEPPKAAANVKDKTKAKQRYLKGKKERRKRRKIQSAPNAAAKQDQRPSSPRESGSEAEGSEGSSEESEVEENVVEVQEPEKTEKAREPRVKKEKPKGQTESQKEKEDAERPRKRRKLESTEENRHESDNDDDAPPASPQLRRSSPTPPALPAFPLPTRPDAPSKQTLALQGLDKALIEAELIDPAKLQAFPSGSSDDGGTGLSERTRKRLKELGITELFAVQTAVIPSLLTPESVKSLYLPYDPPRDLCVSAPTGSGKTLAYVLPIVEVLSLRVVTRLRALIVLPTRDLVTQVRETFEAVAKGRGVKIATASGQHSFAHEQTQLVADGSPDLQGGSSKVDVLICTPGRLIDHLNGTPNFSLQHLRFLVIDEADRLLAQSFQDWLAKVLSATRPPPAPEDSPSPSPTPISSMPRADALAPAYLHLLRGVPHVRTDVDEKRESSCQKLLFSATLTRDPAKIAALNLRDPKYFVVQGQGKDGEKGEEGMMDFAMEKFSMPATLSENMLVCASAEKPLVLFHLVHAHRVVNALVFTKSAESTTRLVRLFEFFEGALGAERAVVAQAYSSDLAPGERKTILERFKNREIDILVCSDLISRGIDISHVSHVVSYDAPVDMRKYVHRVGRTARAGRSGDAWTLVEEQEARYFKTMLKSVDHLDKVKRVRMGEKDVEPLRPAYEKALAQLKDAYTRGAT
ncbi:DEAD-domain-containing protein [Rhodofomes roseus]|uniref:ATP-dependent RNA helicase n=1 Tax=Rhodofomes roseus TaxID=34475 RepID=A0ABQ8KLE9_9APHY|nr:DEAD-domain-containing protein [Rhodofomes roseus]KAH9838407.1 DEAD-domain-containing protein [Rhodofomes roseus]